MCGDGDHRDNIFSRPVVPENPERRRGPILGVRLVDLFAASTLKRGKLVRLEARVPEVGLHQTQRLSDGLETFDQPLVGFEVREVPLGLGGQEELQSSGSSAYLAKLRAFVFPSAD